MSFGFLKIERHSVISEKLFSNPKACAVDDLCSLLSAVASVPRLSGELAHFGLEIRSSRRHLFGLSSDGQHGRALVAARSAALLA